MRMRDATGRMTLLESGRFEARLLPSSWVLPLIPLGAAVVLALTAIAGAPTVLLAVLFAGVAVGVTLLRIVSRITIEANRLCVAFFQRDAHCIGLGQLASITSRTSKASLGLAPALELRSLDRRRVTVRLGWWHRESELLGLLAEAVDAGDATVDDQTAQLLRDRPPGEWWSLEQRQAREAAKKPPGRIQRAVDRLPLPLRYLARAALFVGGLVLMLAAMAGLYVAFELGARFAENVLFPRQIDATWVAELEVPTLSGDSWIGNVVTDGEVIHLATREHIQGFWGAISHRASADGGDTWSEPLIVSPPPHPGAARHGLGIAPDGSLYVGWAEQGPEPVTQRLLIRRSLDGGESWSEPVRASPPSAGLIGLPVFLLTDDVRMVGYTDGVTGEVWVQQLTLAGAADGEPVLLGVTSRQLYNDADFHDGGVTLTAAQARVIAAFVEGEDTLRALASDDGGQSWQSVADVSQDLYGGRPRLASDGSTVLLAATDPNREAQYIRRPFIRIWRSVDGGVTFERVPADVRDAVIGQIELVWADGQWRLLYSACPGFLTCATPPRIWYSSSPDGRDWSDPSVVTEPGNVTPVGLAVGRFGVVAIWAEMIDDHEWDFRLSRRQQH